LSSFCTYDVPFDDKFLGLAELVVERHP